MSVNADRSRCVTDRFWNKARQREDGCWIWCGERDSLLSLAPGKQPYGRFKIAGKRYAAHRVAYRLTKGAIPIDLLVRHTCDNGLCVNPGHLLVGDTQDNMDDCVSRGRLARGSRTGTAKLTEEEVLEIKFGLSRGETLMSLAIAYGVSQWTIHQIAHGLAWVHVIGPRWKRLEEGLKP